MRIVACVSVLVAGLVVGCTSSSKRAPAGGSGGTGAGPEAPRPVDPPPATNVGLLAGTVKDGLDRPVSKARIQVVAAQKGAAPIEVWANEDGTFLIPGLERGQPYYVTARVKDGERMLAATVQTAPNNPKLLLVVSEELATEGTPPVKEPSTLPGSEEAKPKPKKDKKPAASIDRPAPEIKVTVPPVAPDPRRARPDLRIDIHPHVPPPTPEPKPTPVPEVPPTLPAAPEPAPATTPTITGRPTPVPSCQLVGRRLYNFALNDVSGKPWEYRRDHRRGLLLLDFWFTSCRYCVEGIPDVNKLHQDFAAYGVEVIGIANEPGDPVRRVAQVQSAIGRHDLRYKVLMSGDRGPGQPCPVCRNFGVHSYPTTILLDADGNVVWQKEGRLDDRDLKDLRLRIMGRLGLLR